MPSGETDCYETGYVIPQGVLCFGIGHSKDAADERRKRSRHPSAVWGLPVCQTGLRCCHAAVFANDRLRTTKLRHSQGIALNHILLHHEGLTVV